MHSLFVQEYLIKCQGFKESDMLIMLDDGQHHAPTRQNIEQAFTRIVQYSQPGDVVVSFGTQLVFSLFVIVERSKYPHLLGDKQTFLVYTLFWSRWTSARHNW